VLAHPERRPPRKEIWSAVRDSSAVCDTEVATDRWAASTKIRKGELHATNDNTGMWWLGRSEAGCRSVRAERKRCERFDQTEKTRPTKNTEVVLSQSPKVDIVLVRFGR
jgi:hypothetical protein